MSDHDENSSSNGNESQEEEEEEQQEEDEQEEDLSKTFFLRIHAANLPRLGILKSLPDTYAVVTSVSGRAGSQSSLPQATTGTGTPAPAAITPHTNEHVMRTVEWGRTEM
jgi:hypothetical protein